jgi:hypothetical protein
LIPLDIFFWGGYMNNYLYVKAVLDLNHLKARTRKGSEQATADILQLACKKWNIGWP